MGTPYQVEANGELYTVVDDVTTFYWAVITGVASDEIFGTVTAPGFAVTVNRTDLGTKATATGLYAITGYPTQSFPQLATTSYVVDYVLSAPGYRDLPMVVTIPVNATFPVSAPAAAMRLLPVQIQGRVVSSITRLPISGAKIASIDPATPPAVHPTVLRSPVYFAHANGATAQEVSTATIGSAALTQDVVGGDQVLNLSTRTGLAAGSVVCLTYASGVRLEYGVVDHLGPGAAATPGQVFLRSALNCSYPMASTTVTFVSVTPVGGAATLSNDANAGDGVLLASQLFSQAVAIEFGGMLAEVHEVGALTGVDGYYALDGMGRVQEIMFKASQGALNQTVDWFVEYDQPFNIVDFRL
ncbi:MAG TPA: hypothetical protein VI636_25320 [Candidatus Angelobacter sp.]